MNFKFEQNIKKVIIKYCINNYTFLRKKKDLNYQILHEVKKKIASYFINLQITSPQ